MKWLKIGGLAIIFFILIKIFSLFQVFSFEHNKNFISISAFLIVVFTLIVYVGFLILGKYIKNKFLSIVSIIAIVSGILFVLVLLIPSQGLSPLMFLTLPWVFMPLLLGISLLLVKEVKFSKITGIFLILSLVLNYLLYFSFFFGNPVNSVFTITLNFIINIFSIVPYIFMVILFFVASKKFE